MPTPVQEKQKAKKLQKAGYITGYSAQIDTSKLGQTLTVFTEVTLKNHRQSDFARFLQVVERIEEVIECHLISGGYDYLLKFVTGGIGDYQEIMERLIEVDIGIDKYFSYVVIKSPRAGAGGGSTAGPVFAQLMSRALSRYGVAPTGAKPSKIPVEW